MIVIDDVLPSLVFDRFKLLTVDNPNFTFGVCRTTTMTDNVKSFFKEPQPNTWDFEYFSIPLVTALSNTKAVKLKELLRIRFGLLHRDVKQIINTPHVDRPTEPHFVGLYYLNDTDGATKIWKQKLKDWSEETNTPSLDDCELLHEIEPKANRMVIFDGSHFHSSVTPTKTQLRYVINYNYTFDIIGE